MCQHEQGWYNEVWFVVLSHLFWISTSIQSFWHFKCAVMEGMLNNIFQMNLINNKPFCPFEINQGIETPLTEMDPDMQFYSDSHYIQNVNFEYCLEEAFTKQVEDCSATRSNFLNNLSFTLTEKFAQTLWWNWNIPKISWSWFFFYWTHINMTGWKQTRPLRSTWLSLCLRNCISYTNRNDLEYFYSEMETIFIEINSTVCGTKHNVIVAVIYRMPDSSVDVFNERMCHISNVITKEKRICYLVGDLNLDLLKHEEHSLILLIFCVLIMCSDW